MGLIFAQVQGERVELCSPNEQRDRMKDELGFMEP